MTGPPGGRLASLLASGEVEAVVFDWGGTLALHVEVELIDLWRAAALHLDAEDPEPITDRLVAVEAASWARTETTMRSARLMDLLREASDELGVDVAEAVLESAQDAHLDAWTPNIRHHPAAVTVLERIRAADMAVGLLSNTHWPRSFHEQFLCRDGLSDLIDARLYTCEIDWIKPHPQPFHMVAERLGVAIDRCVHVGDRPIDDIRGAAAAGMASVWIANDHAPGTATPDATIHDLADLPALLNLT